MLIYQGKKDMKREQIFPQIVLLDPLGGYESDGCPPTISPIVGE
jgi:hypothetical protein